MTDVNIISESPSLDELLEPLRGALGQDYAGYRNHLYRVLTYTVHFLDGDQTHRALLEAALVYHDIGLWTDNELAYLEPSIGRVLKANNDNQWGFDRKLLSSVIYWHHKILPFRGPNAALVNAFRKADWIDATGGAIRMGLSKTQIKSVIDEIPDAGFSNALSRLITDLGGNPVRGYAQILPKVYKL